MSKTDLKKLGKQIRYLRKYKNISQEKFAELIGKSRNYVGMIERAEVNTPINTLFDISKKLEVNIKELFDFR